jgi:protein SCO1
MKSFPKAGLLIVTLVIPALIFLFLQLFGTNHYSLPYFNPAKGASGEILIQNGDTVYHKITESCVVGGSADFAGKLTVISYLGRDCSDSCEIALAQLKRVAALSDKIPDLKVKTLTIAGNTAAVHFGTGNQDSWEFIQTLEKNIKNCFDLTPGQGGQVFNDPTGVLLVDTESYIRGYYKGSDEKDMDRLMAEIKILEYERKHQ